MRRDSAWIRVERPVYSRVRGGATTFGLWGRVVLTALVLFFLPWGRFNYTTVMYLVAYLPIAGLLLRSIWRRDVVGPAASADIAILESDLRSIRVGGAVSGVALLAVAIGSRALVFGYLPGLLILALALCRPAAHTVAETVAEARKRPAGTLALLNGLNVLDAILSDAAIGADAARELNPVVLAIGTPAKLLLVGALSGLLYWKRPQALVWPTLAFAVLSAYHLTGLLGNLTLG